MKIKLLRDIPGFSKGWEGNTEMECNSNFEILRQSTVGGDTRYSVSYLINMGWAEEIKDDIDIEKTRRAWKYVTYLTDSVNGPKFTTLMEAEEAEWFTAYRIVKAVIEKLNGGWEPSWDDTSIKYLIYGNNIAGFMYDSTGTQKRNILPACKSPEVAKQVISLCEPELKVLFRVK